MPKRVGSGQPTTDAFPISIPCFWTEQVSRTSPPTNAMSIPHATVHVGLGRPCGYWILWLTWTYPWTTTSLNTMNPNESTPYSYGPALPAGNAGSFINTSRCRRFDSL